MQVLAARNVNYAYKQGINRMLVDGVRVETRNGPALQLPYPLTTVVYRPWERVLFDIGRDANPFFHLMEGIWMLAGRNDVEWISQFNSNIENYSDDSKTFHAAYGYRWRNHATDQLLWVVSRLQDNPSCRRQVIQIWDVWQDLGSDSVDIPCNTHVYVQVDTNNRLAMMICNRSNDMIWGAYGANIVHMSMLQEYLAAAIGVAMGPMHMVTMNMHAYSEKLDLLPSPLPLSHDYPTPVPLVSKPEVFLTDCERFCDDQPGITNRFLLNTATPMQAAWHAHKERDYHVAFGAADAISSPDWRKACTEWLSRRKSNWESKSSRGSSTPEE